MATKKKETKEDTTMVSGEVIQLKTYEARIKNLAGHSLLMDKMPESVSQEKGEREVRKADKVKDQKDNFRDKIYKDDENTVYLSKIAIQASMFRGAGWWEEKVFGNVKMATLIKASSAVSTYYNYLKWSPESEDYISADDDKILCFPSVVKKKNGDSIFVARPQFMTWSLTFRFDCFDPRVDIGSFEKVLKYAGYYVGLGAWRPNFGRYELLSLREVPMAETIEDIGI